MFVVFVKINKKSRVEGVEHNPSKIGAHTRYAPILDGYDVLYSFAVSVCRMSVDDEPMYMVYFPGSVFHALAASSK